MFLYKPISKGDKKKQRNQSWVVFHLRCFDSGDRGGSLNPMNCLKRGAHCHQGIMVTMPQVQSRSYTAGFKLQVMEYAEENGGNLVANGSLAFTRKKSDLGENKKMPYDRQKSPRILPQTCTTLARSTRQAWNFRHGAESSLHSPEHCSTATEIAISEEIMINNFQGTVSWCFQFMKRKNLTIRQHTTLSKALPEDQEEMIATFQALVSD